MSGRNRPQSDGDMELGSIHPDSTPFLNEHASGSSSLRSSLDNDYYQSQGCDIHIYDDIASDQATSSPGSRQRFDAATWHGGLENQEGFLQHLKVGQLRPELWTPSSLLPG